MGVWGDGSDCPRVLTPSGPRPEVNGGRGLQVPALTLTSLYLGRLGGTEQTDSNICLLDTLNATLRPKRIIFLFLRSRGTAQALRLRA